jgi:arsenate reductase (glutaredoxin)
MAKIIIYHNPRCKKSRAGLAYLQEKNVEIDIVKYLDEGIKEARLQEMFALLGVEPLEMIRKQEKAFKQELKGKELSDAEYIKAISTNLKLLQRPIVVIDNERAVWADPPENLDEIL